MADPALERLARDFPRLKTGRWKETSPPSRRYNCVAWAAGDARRWWWPGSVPPVFWPGPGGGEPSIGTFERLFEAMGYEACGGEAPEPGFEKVALFAEGPEVLHAARQLPGGRWTSKLGKGIDIEHELADLEGGIYGNVVRILRRRAPP